MKYILIVTALYPPEPVVSARLSNDIYLSLKERGREVKVLHPKPTRPDGYSFQETIVSGCDEIVTDSFTSPHSTLLGRFYESYSFGKTSSHYIKTHKDEIEVIYANTWPLFGQFYIAKTANKYGIPYYMHIQDVYPESYCYKLPNLLGKILRRALLPIDKYVINHAAKVVAISPAMISYLSRSRNVDVDRFILVRNWQDDKAYIEVYKPIEKGIKTCHIMYLGSLNPTANVNLIIESVSRARISNYYLSIIGNGPEKGNCMELAETLGMKVNFESVAPEQVADKQSSAHILILCLKKGVAHTATPSKLTAYMLSGRPIIASVDIDSDCATIIRESRCGIVVEPDNMDDLSRAIEMIAAKSVLELNEMGSAAFVYAQKQLSKDANLKKVVDLIISK